MQKRNVPFVINMKVLLLLFLLLIGETAGGKGGRGKGSSKRTGASYASSHGQRSPPAPTENNNEPQNQPSYDYFAPPPPTQNLGGAYLAALPSSTVAAGASVTVTCKFTAPINKKPVYFAIVGSLEDSNLLMFDTSSITVGQTMMIAEQVGVVVNDASVSLMYYKAKTSDSGVYQCYIPNVATSNELTVTVTAQVSVSGQLQNSTAQIVAITLPLALVLLAMIAILVLRFCCGCRFPGVFQIGSVQPATGANTGEVGKSAIVKLDVLDPADLPTYDDAANTAPELYRPPCYDEAVYSNDKRADGGEA